MHECNAGQPNLQKNVTRISLIYRSAPVNYAKRDAFWCLFCIILRGTISKFFPKLQNTKKCSSDDLFLLIVPYFASNHEKSLSKSKNFPKTLFFAAETNRLKPTIWRSKNRLKQSTIWTLKIDH